MKRIWAVEKADSDLAFWRTGILFGPRVKKGIITLGGTTYTVDSRRARHYTEWRKLWLGKRDVSLQLWQEGMPEPAPLFADLPKEDEDGGAPRFMLKKGGANPGSHTGALLAQAADSEALKQLAGKRTDIRDVLLLLSILANFVLSGLIFLRGG